MATFGERLRQLRQEAHLTQTQLGSRIGMSAGAISQKETGIRGVTPQDIKNLAEFFNVSTAYMMGEETGEEAFFSQEKFPPEVPEEPTPQPAEKPKSSPAEESLPTEVADLQNEIKELRKTMHSLVTQKKQAEDLLAKARAELAELRKQYDLMEKLGIATSRKLAQAKQQIRKTKAAMQAARESQMKASDKLRESIMEVKDL